MRLKCNRSKGQYRTFFSAAAANINSRIVNWTIKYICQINVPLSNALLKHLLIEIPPQYIFVFEHLNKTHYSSLTTSWDRFHSHIMGAERSLKDRWLRDGISNPSRFSYYVHGVSSSTPLLWQQRRHASMYISYFSPSIHHKEHLNSLACLLDLLRVE